MPSHPGAGLKRRVLRWLTFANRPTRRCGYGGSWISVWRCAWRGDGKCDAADPPPPTRRCGCTSVIYALMNDNVPRSLGTRAVPDQGQLQ
ncbi:hypothetical protein SKAU_G00345810 [Synaphobranchus kaupii]|uniref:Uncharacterized protein n=1 Tax=Synaphobranchus kaupii TaxID=118154 RepID=A0A9Q1EJM8_SYNKA|nr:hypothetical protein SKAU_G00345810 [Synaphobranchus kaupii]